MPPTQPRLIIHGGAGNITPTNLPPASWTAYRDALGRTLRSTAQLLAAGSSCLDAAVHAVRQLEEDALFNCGRGAVFTRAGTIELEASLMVSRGRAKRGVGVALVKRVRNPIVLARELLVRGGEAGRHCLLSGEVVEGLAEGWGVEMVSEGWHWTRRRWEEHRRGLGEEVEVEGGGYLRGKGTGEEMLEGGWDGREYLPQGTVGCVALDRYGVLCVATSTGGLTNKLPGRIGDTPSLGAGFWAEEWEVPRPVVKLAPTSPLVQLSGGVLRVMRECIPDLVGYVGLPDADVDEKSEDAVVRGVAMSGTGNGDSFLRLAAVRTAGAIARFAPGKSLASGVTQIVGPGGEMQLSAGDRWGKTGEGEGGIIGIEVVGGKGTVVFDFNCGGMFRAWVDNDGIDRVMVFKHEHGD